MRIILGYLKLSYLYIFKKYTSNEDIKNGYNAVKNTYHLWTNHFGKHTNLILDKKYLISKKPLRILDLACGTGYITSKLLSDLKQRKNLNIIGVDLSDEMINYCQKNINDPRAEFEVNEALEYLTKTPLKFDAVFCGWGLIYLDKLKIIKAVKNVLNKNGIFGIITNIEGTLSGIEEIYIKTMAENPTNVLKLSQLSKNLPENSQEINNLFVNNGFSILKSGDKEEIFEFKSAILMFNWLNSTGVLASLDMIFKDPNYIHQQILKKIKQLKKINEKYQINHKFAFGIYLNKVE